MYSRQLTLKNEGSQGTAAHLQTAGTVGVAPHAYDAKARAIDLRRALNANAETRLFGQMKPKPQEPMCSGHWSRPYCRT